MRKDEPYHFVRFLWAAKVDLEVKEAELAEYVVGWMTPPLRQSPRCTYTYTT